MQSINPSNLKLIKEYQQMDDIEVNTILADTQKAFLKYKLTSFKDRKQLMLKVARILKEKAVSFASVISREMGKTITEALMEVEKCAWVCEYYAANAEKFLKEEKTDIKSFKGYVRFEPLGIIFAVMPWNFPFWQVFRFAVPTLIAGNAVILKHASNVCGCSLLIEKIFREAGFPKNIFRSLLIDQEQAAKVIAHNNIKAVTLTGSVQAGMAVAKQAGSFAKKTVLELGGSDPYIILADANIDKAAEICVKSRMINGGQSCIAAKRFIVHTKIYDKFVELVVAKMKFYIMGDPLNKKIKLGPMATLKQRDTIHEQVMASIEKGANCILGGNIPECEGAYYPPTILIDVKKGMPAYDDEIFGPVASIIKVKNNDEAIKVANDSVFGLGAAIFTKKNGVAKELAAKIDTGMVAINDFVRSDPRMPFGGVKQSGYGRELALFGIREFVNIKTVVVGGG